MPSTTSGEKERVAAQDVLSIVESHNIDTMGAACSMALDRITGSKIVGIYLLDKPTPELLYSNEVPTGFLSDYRSGLGQSDPLIQNIILHGQVLDGPSYFGSDKWKRTVTYDLLHNWGLSSNMCGPLRHEGKTVGIVYTANRDEASPYSIVEKQWMEMLCRAASLALKPVLTDNKMTLRADLPERAAIVAEMICRGLSNKQIAREMGISHHTVKEHASILFKKFGSTNRTTLAVALQYSDRNDGQDGYCPAEVCDLLP